MAAGRSSRWSDWIASRSISPSTPAILAGLGRPVGCQPRPGGRADPAPVAGGRSRPAELRGDLVVLAMTASTSPGSAADPVRVSGPAGATYRLSALRRGALAGDRRNAARIPGSRAPLSFSRRRTSGDCPGSVVLPRPHLAPVRRGGGHHHRAQGERAVDRSGAPPPRSPTEAFASAALGGGPLPRLTLAASYATTAGRRDYRALAVAEVPLGRETLGLRATPIARRLAFANEQEPPQPAHPTYPQPPPPYPSPYPPRIPTRPASRPCASRLSARPGRTGARALAGGACRAGSLDAGAPAKNRKADGPHESLDMSASGTSTATSTRDALGLDTSMTYDTRCAPPGTYPGWCSTRKRSPRSIKPCEWRR